jgi:hypothetical protein
MLMSFELLTEIICRFCKTQKSNASFVMSVRLSVRTEKGGFQGKDFHQI